MKLVNPTKVAPGEAGALGYLHFRRGFKGQ
jgi:hypothetical protein